MQLYLEALRLLEQATEKVENAGDTLILAHLELPISLLRERLEESAPNHKSSTT